MGVVLALAFVLVEVIGLFGVRFGAVWLGSAFTCELDVVFAVVTFWFLFVLVLFVGVVVVVFELVLVALLVLFEFVLFELLLLNGAKRWFVGGLFGRLILFLLVLLVLLLLVFVALLLFWAFVVVLVLGVV